jgi:hypothetical protein
VLVAGATGNSANGAVTALRGTRQRRESAADQFAGEMLLHHADFAALTAIPQGRACRRVPQGVCSHRRGVCQGPRIDPREPEERPNGAAASAAVPRAGRTLPRDAAQAGPIVRALAGRCVFEGAAKAFWYNAKVLKGQGGRVERRDPRDQSRAHPTRRLRPRGGDGGPPATSLLGPPAAPPAVDGLGAGSQCRTDTGERSSACFAASVPGRRALWRRLEWFSAARVAQVFRCERRSMGYI